MSSDFNNPAINKAAQERFPNSELCRIGFEAGAVWQRQQDAKPELLPKFEIRGRPAARLQELVQQSDAAWIRVSTVDVQVLSDAEAHESHSSRMLSSIENRLIELAGGPGIERLSGWLERLDKDIYHVTTRQESIDIEQRKILASISGQVEDWGNCIHSAVVPKDNEKGSPDVSLDDAVNETPGTFGGEFSRLLKEAYMKSPPIVAGFDPSRGDDFTSVFAFDVTRKATPLEEVSDELLDQMKEQIPVSVYVAEVERRQKLKASNEAVEGLRKDRDGWRHAYERLVSDILHGRSFSVTIKPD